MWVITRIYLDPLFVKFGPVVVDLWEFWGAKPHTLFHPRV